MFFVRWSIQINLCHLKHIVQWQSQLVAVVLNTAETSQVKWVSKAKLFFWVLNASGIQKHSTIRKWRCCSYLNAILRMPDPKVFYFYFLRKESVKFGECFRIFCIWHLLIMLGAKAIIVLFWIKPSSWIHFSVLGILIFFKKTVLMFWL